MPTGANSLSRMRGACTSTSAIALALVMVGCAPSAAGTPRASPISSAPLAPSLANQTVYVTVSLGQQTQNPGVTLALNAQTGALRWKADTGGTGGSPAIASGAVYLAPEDGSIRSLDAASGAPRWSYARATGVSPQFGYDGYATVSGGSVYVASDSGALFALDTATGKARWSVDWPSPSDTLYAAPAVDANLVFVAVGGPDGGAYALDAATGKTVWKTLHSLGFDTKPLVADGAVYLGSQGPDTLVALDEKTGAPRWQTGASGINSAPVAAGGLIYVAGADEIVRAYHALDGSPAWTFQTGGVAGNALLGTGAALASDASALYVGSQGGDLYALDLTTGKSRWTRAINSPIDAPPALAGGAVFVTTESGQILAYRATDGAPAWSDSGGANALITSGPVIAASGA